MNFVAHKNELTEGTTESFFTEPPEHPPEVWHHECVIPPIRTDLVVRGEGRERREEREGPFRSE